MTTSASAQNAAKPFPSSESNAPRAILRSLRPMKSLKRICISVFILVASLYLLVCGWLYFGQESLIFHPKKLAADFVFEFDGNFEERMITATDGTVLHGLHFRAKQPRAVVLYLHGNAGALDTWGDIADYYTNELNLDFFIPDYRGFGKSEGEIESQQQFFDDAQVFYDLLKKEYDEQQIIVIGYSIGTCPAAMLAAQNNPQILMLKAPYFSLVDMMERLYPFAPTFLLEYEFPTWRYVKETEEPIVVFLGKVDEIIPNESSEKLKEFLKDDDLVITLPQQGHNGMNDNEAYRRALADVLKLGL